MKFARVQRNPSARLPRAGIHHFEQRAQRRVEGGRKLHDELCVCEIFSREKQLRKEQELEAALAAPYVPWWAGCSK